MKKGFTLIELLVVIAIIGILATIVVVNVNSSRVKANDVAIKGFITQSRSVAELVYNSDSNNYSGVCNSSNLLNSSHAIYGSQLGLLHEEITNNNGGVSEICYDSDTAYCVSAKLKSSATVVCADSEGRVNSTPCSATTYSCQ